VKWEADSKSIFFWTTTEEGNVWRKKPLPMPNAAESSWWDLKIDQIYPLVISREASMGPSGWTLV
jgi:hypothetical protein